MHKKNILIFLPLFYILCIIAGEYNYSQPAISWTQRYNGLLDSIDIAKDITVDNSGNSYVTGNSYEILGLLSDIFTISYDSGGNIRWRAEYNGILSDEGTVIILDNTQQYVYVAGFTNGMLGFSADYIIIKYEVSSGNEIWVKTYDGGILGNDRVTSIAVDGQNNPIITGYSEGLILLSSYDYATIKYNQNNGNQIWASRFSRTNTSEDRAYAIIVDNSDNVIVTGSSTSGSDVDYATVKYNSSGNQQWSRFYGNFNGSEDRAYAIIVDNSDNIVVTGESEGNSSNLDYATIKYDPNGNQLWASRYNGPGNNEDRAYAIIVDNSDNFIVTGQSDGAGSASDYSTVKYNNNGNQVWVNRYNGLGNNEDRAYAIIVDNTDNVYVTGSSMNSSASGSEDYATLKYDSAGTQQWNPAIYNGTGNNEDRAYAIIVDNSDNIYVTGSSRNGSLIGTEDYLTIKYSGENLVPIGSNNIPSRFHVAQNFPNPFNPVTSIKLEIPAKLFVRIEIYDILGNRIEVLANNELNPGIYNLEWNAENYPSGIYFYSVQSPRELRITRKMILLK